MTLHEIQSAVRSGQTVHVGNAGYTVTLHTFPDGREQWNIVFASNGYCIGLTGMDGVTLNGKEEEFYVADSVEAPPSPDFPTLIVHTINGKPVAFDILRDEGDSWAKSYPFGQGAMTHVLPLALCLRARAMESALRDLVSRIDVSNDSESVRQMRDYSHFVAKAREALA